MVYAAGFGSNYVTVPFKYLWQTVRSLRILVRERPSTVFVMTPPVVACVPVWLFCRLFGARFVIDAHSGAFLNSRWKNLLFLHKWFSRSARTTIVTNEHLQDRLTAWNCHSTIVRDVPVCFAAPSSVSLEGINMTLVATFTPDEPIGLFFEAARKVPDIQFHVTGNSRRAEASLLNSKPPNVRLTGFLPDSDYVGLVLASDAVITLTTRDHTMQRGAYEGVYLGRPVITSNFPLLRRHFYKGTVHVDITVESIVKGIEFMRDNLIRFQAEIESLRRERLGEWEIVAAGLREIAAGK